MNKHMKRYENIWKQINKIIKTYETNMEPQMTFHIRTYEQTYEQHMSTYMKTYEKLKNTYETHEPKKHIWQYMKKEHVWTTIWNNTKQRWTHINHCDKLRTNRNTYKRKNKHGNPYEHIWKIREHTIKNNEAYMKQIWKYMKHIWNNRWTTYEHIGQIWNTHDTTYRTSMKQLCKAIKHTFKTNMTKYEHPLHFVCFV